MALLQFTRILISAVQVTIFEMFLVTNCLVYAVHVARLLIATACLKLAKCCLVYA